MCWEVTRTLQFRDGRHPHPTLSKWTRPIIRASVLGEGALRCGAMPRFTGRASFSCRQSRPAANRNDFRTIAPNSAESGYKNPSRLRVSPPPQRVRLREVLVISVLQTKADRSTSLRLTVKRIFCTASGGCGRAERAHSNAAAYPRATRPTAPPVTPFQLRKRPVAGNTANTIQFESGQQGPRFHSQWEQDPTRESRNFGLLQQRI